MDKILRLNEFFVEGGKQQVSHVLLHITEPSTPEEMHKGNFFAVCEINNAETRDALFATRWAIDATRTAAEATIGAIPPGQ